MKLKIERGYILVVSPKLVYTLALFNGVAQKAKGAAVFPFLFVKDETLLQSWLVNHERIHFRQQIEMLFIGMWVLWIYEHLYARLILKLTTSEAYVYGAGEQEAYLNQNNPQYLNQRKPYAIFYYIKHKRKFTSKGNGELEMLD